MQFNEFDVKVIFVAVLSLLLVSATATATPLAGGYGEPPTFDTNANLNLNPPNQPNTNTFSQGTLVTGPNVTDFRSEKKVINTEGLEVELQTSGYDPNNESYDVNLALEYQNSSDNNTHVTLETLNVSESASMEVQDVGVTVEYVENNSEKATINWVLEYYPDLSKYEDDGDNGGLVQQIQNVASWLGYIGEWIAFGLKTIFDGLVFVTQTLMDIVTYMFEIVSWIAEGYGSIVEESPSWASPFIALPGLLLGLELMKLIMLAVNLLWIG